MDRRVLLVQEEFLPWQVAKQVPGQLGEMPSFYEEQEIQDVPRRCKSTHWRVG